MIFHGGHLSVFLHDVKTPFSKEVVDPSPSAEIAIILGSFSLFPNKSLCSFATISFARNLFSLRLKNPVLKKNYYY